MLLCNSHREKAWVEWCRKKDHGVSHAQDSLLPLLRSIAAASTPEEFSTRLCNLQEAKVWKDNEKVRAWFSNKWLPEAKVCIKFKYYIYFYIIFIISFVEFEESSFYFFLSFLSCVEMGARVSGWRSQGGHLHQQWGGKTKWNPKAFSSWRL